MLRESNADNTGFRAYSLSTAPQSLASLFTAIQTHASFTNRVKDTAKDGDAFGSSAFVQYDKIDFNYDLNNDGARVASRSAEGEATPGFACRVDGHMELKFGGQVCRGQCTGVLGLNNWWSSMQCAKLLNSAHPKATFKSKGSVRTRIPTKQHWTTPAARVVLRPSRSAGYAGSAVSFSPGPTAPTLSATPSSLPNESWVGPGFEQG